MGGNEPKETSEQDEDDYWLVSQQAQAFRDEEEKKCKVCSCVKILILGFFFLRKKDTEEFSCFFQNTADTSTDISKAAQCI